ncbi:MAG: hypothetical protein HOC74_06260 [Gemmatimonadetes bacterium]|nr:hypothetical protein [Gemmatimonadota bacterium]
MCKWRVWCLIPLLLVGCSQNYSDKKVDQALAEKKLTPAPRAPQQQLPAGHPQVGEGGRHSLKGVSAILPEGWQQSPPSSSMRVAEYLLPGEAYKAADAGLAVFYFGRNQGGGLEANIERWYGQFSQPDGGSTKERSSRSEREVNGMPVTLVDIKGTFNSGGMGGGQGAQEGYRMLGGIVQSPAGSFFFKLTGPEATVEGWAASFDQYLDSIQPE